MTTLNGGDSRTHSLPVGQVLTVVAGSLGFGAVSRLSDIPGGEPQGYTPVAAGETKLFGPYAAVARFRIDADTSSLTATMAPAVPVPLVVGTLGDLRELSGAGIPDASAQAVLTINPTGDDNGLIFTAVAYGAPGNDISIEYLDPAANDAALAVSVLGTKISVSLATGSGGAITSTAADVLAAIEASAAASDLVTGAIMTADSGVADDGSGIVTAMALAPLVDGAGIGVNVAGIGSRYTDTTNGKIYINGGTKAVPVWNIVTSA